jgi:hypothetical protein
VTLDELRKHFWWLGPGKPGSHIVALDGANVIVKVVQATWNRRTGPYEEAVARDFAALGFTVTWVPYWRDDLQAQIDEARNAAEKKGQPFDEIAFVAKKRHEERR